MRDPGSIVPDALGTIARERHRIVREMIENGETIGRRLREDDDAILVQLYRQQQELACRYDALGGEGVS